MKKVWCVAWFKRNGRGEVIGEEWCACKSQPKTRAVSYRDHIRTRCEMVVTCTVGVEKREPTCPECLEGKE